MIKPESNRRDDLRIRSREVITLFPLIVVLLVFAAVIEGVVSLPRATAAVEKTLSNQDTKTNTDETEPWVIRVPIDWQQEDLGILESGHYAVRLFSETEPLSVFVRRTELSSDNDERKSILNLIASQVNNDTSYDFVSRPEPIMLNGQPAIRFKYWINLNQRRDFNISYAVVSLTDRSGKANLYRIDAVMPDIWAEVSDDMMQKVVETFNFKN